MNYHQKASVARATARRPKIDMKILVALLVLAPVGEETKETLAVVAASCLGSERARTGAVVGLLRLMTAR